MSEPLVATCGHCQQSFRLKRKAQRFCSRQCGATATFDPARRIRRRPCAQCGMDFLPAGPRNTCCSKRCAGRFSHRNDVLIPPAERFWSHVEKSDGCWLWTAAVNNKGYGLFGITSKSLILAHRFSWELHNGPIPEDAEVCHNCPGGDRRCCVNPAHLFLGSHSANMADAVKKGQFRTEKNRKRCKISDNDVREARRLRVDECLTYQAIADRFHINYRHAWDIINGRRRQAVQ